MFWCLVCPSFTLPDSLCYTMWIRYPQENKSYFPSLPFYYITYITHSLGGVLSLLICKHSPNTTRAEIATPGGPSCASKINYYIGLGRSHSNTPSSSVWLILRPPSSANCYIAHQNVTFANIQFLQRDMRPVSTNHIYGSILILRIWKYDWRVHYKCLSPTSLHLCARRLSQPFLPTWAAYHALI